MEKIHTIYGLFTADSKRRLDHTHDQEAATIAAFIRALEIIKPSVFYDIGSNIGIYAIAAVDNESIQNIYAFEPTPSSYAYLQKNISLQNNPQKIKAFCLALSNEKGVAEFFDYGNEAGDNSLKEKKKSDPNRLPTSIEVEVDKFDNIFADQNRVFAAKIDVEGAEFMVVDGALEYFKNNYGFVQIEHFQGNEDSLIEKMKDLGYSFVLRIIEDYIFTNMSDPMML